MNVINGARIIPDPIRQQQRAAGRSRQQQSTPAMPAIKDDDDPWASEM